MREDRIYIYDFVMNELHSSPNGNISQNNWPSLNQRIKDAYKNTREFVTFIRRLNQQQNHFVQKIGF